MEMISLLVHNLGKDLTTALGLGIDNYGLSYCYYKRPIYYTWIFTFNSHAQKDGPIKLDSSGCKNRKYTSGLASDSISGKHIINIKKRNMYEGPDAALVGATT